jgi:hypothetical protein
METVLEEPPSQPEIREGFRPPFTPATAKLANLKSVAAKRARKEAAEALSRQTPPNDIAELAARITLLRLAQTRMWRMCIASSSPGSIAVYAEAAREAFNQERLLLGVSGTKSRKRVNGVQSREIAPLESGGNDIAPGLTHATPEQAAPPEDDTPF